MFPHISNSLPHVVHVVFLEEHDINVSSAIMSVEEETHTHTEEIILYSLQLLSIFTNKHKKGIKRHINTTNCISLCSFL